MLVCILATALFASGCRMAVPATVAPIPTRFLPFAAGTRTDTLVVFLPGRGGSQHDFERQGLLRILRETGVRADVIAVDAHLGYYYNGTIIPCLMADVINPARKRGYRRIVLAGISLGGLGALLCQRDEPGAADALVLLSPYLGENPALFHAIAAAGGPAAWAAGRPLRSGEVDEQIWTFLGRDAATLPPTWLFFGRSDRFAAGQRLLAPLLPPGHVVEIAGAHDWRTWRSLWRRVCVQPGIFSAVTRE